jgi:hypothetical protein
LLTYESIIEKDIGSERLSYFDHQLSNLLVHRVESISLKSFVEDDKGKIEGKTSNGSAIIEDLPNGLQIYLRRCDNLGTISPVFLSAMKDFLCLNEQSYALFQRVVMCDDIELIREDLEKHGIGEIEQQLPHSAPDMIAGNDGDSDESLTESDSSTPSIGPSHRQEAPIPSRTKARPRDNQPRIGVKGPSGPPSPMGARHYNDQKLSNASPSNSSRFRSPTPDPTERSIFEVFQNSVIIDTTPLVARKGIAQDGTVASAFDTGALSDALQSISVARGPVASQSLSPSASPYLQRPRSHHSRHSIEPPAWDEGSTVATAPEQDIGFYGELFVFQYLKQLLGPSITYKTWTSAYRNRAFRDPRMFQEAGKPDEKFEDRKQKHNSDFTYVDHDGRLGQYLSQRGRHLPRWKDKSGKEIPLTFHLEVKSTPGRLDDAFHLSNNQMDLAKKWSLRIPLLDVYVVLRVYDLDYENALTAKVMHYVDPWRMVCDGTLHLWTSNGFEVTPSNTASVIPFKDMTTRNKVT